MAVNTVILIFLVYSLYSFRTLSILFCVINGGESEVAQSCPTLSDPMDCSLPGSSVHGIFQANTHDKSGDNVQREFLIEMSVSKKLSCLVYFAFTAFSLLPK